MNFNLARYFQLHKNSVLFLNPISRGFFPHLVGTAFIVNTIYCLDEIFAVHGERLMEHST
jgi:hypothetical protein